MTVRRAWMVLAWALTPAMGATAQPLGTFRWQLQPFCNVVTLTVTQVDSVYRLEGTDDQCGNGADRASAIGTAFVNPDQTVGIGLNIVPSPGGVPVQVDAALAPGGFSGTWRDNAGGSGTFVFTSGAGNGGTPRPLLAPPVPATIQLRTDGGLLAGGTVGAGTIPASGPGSRLMWHPGKAAFRAGIVSAAQWDDAAIGDYSAAFGASTQARGPASMAMGSDTTASGIASFASGSFTVATAFASTALGNSTNATGSSSTAMGTGTLASGSSGTAMGSNTSASGTSSTAMGGGTLASGTASTAMGTGTLASGFASTAMGIGAIASGRGSVAIGDNVIAAGGQSIAMGSHAHATAAATGSFVFADDSSSTVFQSFTPNQFSARATGGFQFFTNVATTTGCVLPSGSGVLSCTSDRASKERFASVDGEDVLHKLAAMPIERWSYKDEPGVAHVGPVAQDFHAAFGLGTDDRSIGHLDLSGISLRAIQALELRTRDLERRLAEALALLAGMKEARP